MMGLRRRACWPDRGSVEKYSICSIFSAGQNETLVIGADALGAKKND